MLIDEQIDAIADGIPDLKEKAQAVKETLHEAVEKGGNPTRTLADILHGTWLGHPLHPVLTDVALGGWLLGGLFDLFSVIPGNKGAGKAADTLTTVGTAAAIPTALSGLADFSTIKQDAVEHGAIHGILNGGALLSYLLSVSARKKGSRILGLAFSAVGLSLASLAAYVGGELTYRMRVGVNHARYPKQPEGWTAVLAEGDLNENERKRVEVEGNPVLLYRYSGTVHAIGAVCSHAGGPLEEGEFDVFCVTCPWHDSTFDVRDGSVVHGPATYEQPHYQARIRNEQIEVRVDPAYVESESHDH